MKPITKARGVGEFRWLLVVLVLVDLLFRKGWVAHLAVGTGVPLVDYRRFIGFGDCGPCRVPVGSDERNEEPRHLGAWVDVTRRATW